MGSGLELAPASASAAAPPRPPALPLQQERQSGRRATDHSGPAMCFLVFNGTEQEATWWVEEGSARACLVSRAAGIRSVLRPERLFTYPLARKHDSRRVAASAPGSSPLRMSSTRPSRVRPAGCLYTQQWLCNSAVQRVPVAQCIGVGRPHRGHLKWGSLWGRSRGGAGLESRAGSHHMCNIYKKMCAELEPVDSSCTRWRDPHGLYIGLF